MAQLISPDKIRSIAFTNNKISDRFFKDQFIEIAQEQHIRPVLTDDLYDDIVAKNDADTLAGKDKILLEDFVQPALAFYVKWEVLPEMNMQTANKGTRQLGDEVSSASSSKDRADLYAKVKSHADTLRDKITRFIQDEDNIDDFPLYKRGANVTNTTNFLGGIVVIQDEEEIDPDNIPFELRIL